MQVTIDTTVLADILLAVALTPIEVSGFGRVERKGNIFSLVPEIVVFQQRGSMGGTEFSGKLETLDQNSFSSFLREMLRSGKGELINQYKLWWHSHVYHGARFSATDNAQMEHIAANTSEEWWLRLVANKYGDFSLYLDQFKPYRNTVEMVKDVNVNTIPLINKESLRRMMNERRERMQRIIDKNIAVVEMDPIDLILREPSHETD